MNSAAQIRTFVAACARRFRRKALVHTFLLTGAALLFLALIAPWLAIGWTGHQALPWVIALLGLSLTMPWLLSYRLARRKWATEKATASALGALRPDIRSALLSALEFTASEKQQVGESQGLLDAHMQHTANALDPISPAQTIAIRPPSGLLRICLALLALNAMAALLFANSLGPGFRSLFQGRPFQPFDGARLADSPLVGDVEIVLRYPSYTRKAPMQLSASSGDFEAMAGSTVEIRTRPLGSGGATQSLALLFSSPDSDTLESDTVEEEVLLQAEGSDYRASFLIEDETHYRFALTRQGTRTVEKRARKISIATDLSPTIELIAPAEVLDVAKLKRIELAYLASDDFGLAQIDLVYKEEGGKEVRIPLLEQRGPETIKTKEQDTYLWDLSTLPIRPGVLIEYHLEARDNATAGSATPNDPNVGRSKSYKLRVFSPREKHEELVARQRAVAEALLDSLAGRLTVALESLEEHTQLNRAAESIVLELGALIAALKDDELASKALIGALTEMRNRTAKRQKSEERELALLGEKARASTELASSFFRNLSVANTSSVVELEDDVLALAAWLTRQRLENQLTLRDEMKASQDRISKLFEEYKRTGDATLLAEIERELANLQRNLAQSASQMRSMPEDVLDRFINMEALESKESAGCLEEVKELLKSGQADLAMERMKECKDSLQEQSDSLEKSLQDLRSENFGEAEEAYNKKLSELADLQADQEEVAAKMEEIEKDYLESAAKTKSTSGKAAIKKSKEALARLREKIRQIPKAGMTPYAKEELELLKERVAKVDEALEQGDFAEALAMAKHSKRSLDTMQEEIQYSIDDSFSRKAVSAEKAVRAALPVSRELLRELSKSTPAPSEIMSSKARKDMEALRRRQKSITKRSQKLMRKLEENKEPMPGKSGDAMSEGLKRAEKHMQRSEERMKSRDPSSARLEAKEAARRLRDAKERAQGAARNKMQRNGSSFRDDPIRIPGADSYRAPEKFREEILKAMEDEAAPQGFSDQVKQYYKEIVR